MPYEGLAQEEFDDIHDSVMEAMAFVTLPITFLRPNPAEVDDLYGEEEGGVRTHQPYAVLKASYQIKPRKEILTRRGLSELADVMAFIPRQVVLNWEEANDVPLVLTSKMFIEVENMLFNVEEVRADRLPVGGGQTSDYIGIVITGTLKPHR